MVLIITEGLESINSYPALLNSSKTMAICSSPLAFNSNTLGSSVVAYFKETFFLVASIKNSSSFLEVSYSPSLPARGEVLTLAKTDTVGGSTVNLGKGSTTAISQRESPISAFSMPATMTISPAYASST